MKYARHRFYKKNYVNIKKNKVMMQNHTLKLLLNRLRLMRGPNFICTHLST